MSLDTITITGNLTADPELRFTSSGVAVAGFTIASSTRVLDKDTNEWKDGDTLFLRASAWRNLAENIAETAFKGTSVIVTGKLKTRTFEDKGGEKRTVIEMDVEDFGISLKRAKAVVTKVAGGPAASAAAPAAPKAAPAAVVEDEDAPF